MDVDVDLDQMVDSAASTLHRLVRLAKQLLEAQLRQAEAVQASQPSSEHASQIAGLQKEYTSCSTALREAIAACCQASEQQHQQHESAAAASNAGGTRARARAVGRVALAERSSCWASWAGQHPPAVLIAAHHRTGAMPGDQPATTATTLPAGGAEDAAEVAALEARLSELQQQAQQKNRQLKGLIDQCRLLMDSLCMWETNAQQSAGG